MKPVTGIRARLALVLVVFGFSAACPALPIFQDDFGTTTGTCSLAAWTSFSGADAAPSIAPSGTRYAGPCAFNAGINGVLVDETPSDETRYIVRFYVFAAHTDSSWFVFRANDDIGGTAFQLAYNTLAQHFELYIGSQIVSPDLIAGPAPGQAWYSVEIDFNSNGGAEGVTMLVQGAGASSPLSTTPMSAVTPTTGQQVDLVRMGPLAPIGTPGVVDYFFFDEFSSNSAIPIGRVCRGDANGDGNLDADDYGAITDVILRRATSEFQVDCDEDGFFDVKDRVCLKRRIDGSEACP